MDKIVYRTQGSGVVWDSRRNKIFHDFNSNRNLYTTIDKDDIAYMERLGFKFEKIVVDVEEEKKEEIKIDTKVEEVIKEEKVEEKPKDDIDLPLPEPLSKESIMKLLDDKGIEYKKNMKAETLQKLLDESN